MADDLKPCPFCGADPWLDPESHDGWWHVECTNCGADGPQAVRRRAALDVWNGWEGRSAKSLGRRGGSRGGKARGAGFLKGPPLAGAGGPVAELDTGDPVPGGSPRTMACPGCDGGGWVGGVFGEECRSCGGKGSVPWEPSAEDIEIARLTAALAEMRRERDAVIGLLIRKKGRWGRDWWDFAENPFVGRLSFFLTEAEAVAAVRAAAGLDTTEPDHVT